MFAKIRQNLLIRDLNLLFARLAWIRSERVFSRKTLIKTFIINQSLVGTNKRKDFSISRQRGIDQEVILIASFHISLP